MRLPYYAIQVYNKRFDYWFDFLTFYDKVQCFRAYDHFNKNGALIRVIEVYKYGKER